MQCLCPLCGCEKTSAFFEDWRDYLRCSACLLVFVPPQQFVTHEAEKAFYDLHQNSPDDPRYRRFLARLFDPLSARLLPGSHGLDFGSGPGPTLSVMFEEAGHSMTLYDIFYAPDVSVLQRHYDFITATEVVEHLHRPRMELDRLWACVRNSGFLGLMTKRVRDEAAFSRWHYKNDRTHVCFFSVETFQWLAAHWGANMTVVDEDVVVFEKTS